MPQQHIDASTLKSLEQDFSDELDSMREQVLATYAKLAKIPRSSATVHSFHGKIGSKNNEYTDAIRTQFSDPDDFIAKWLKGLCDSVADDKADGYERAATRLARLLKNKVIRDYTFKFLTRNFYRNLVERTRAKPRDRPALQDILEKCVRELGAIRLIDSRIGVPGQLACNPRVILGCFRTTIGFACLHILVLLVILRLHCIHSDIHRTSGSLGCNFCCTHDIDATGLAGVASHRHHRWLGILDFASRTGHRAVVC